MPRDLSGYEEVPDRIRRFFEKYPDGSLQCESVEYRMLPAAHLGGEEGLHIIYHAAAYRTAVDPKPGHGMASEPIPGLTPYTKGSELMNAETSAWGRALVALGFVAKTVASANEVRARQEGSPVAERAPYGRKDDGTMATPAQKGRITKDLKALGMEEWKDQAPLWHKLIGTNLPQDKLIVDVATKVEAGVVISRLKQGAVPTGKSDVPYDAKDFEPETLYKDPATGADDPPPF